MYMHFDNDKRDESKVKYNLEKEKNAKYKLV